MTGGPGGHQNAGHVDVVVGQSQGERAVTEEVRAGNIGPGPDQEQGDVGEAVVERGVKGGVAQAGHQVHISPRLQQAPHSLSLVMVITCQCKSSS